MSNENEKQEKVSYDPITAFYELKNISDNLKNKTIELSDMFENVEEKLNLLNFTLTEWSDTLIGVRENDNYAYKFGYCKVKDDWKLVCRRVRTDRPDNNKRYGLLEFITGMPRGIKIEAAGCLENLLEKIIKKALRYTKDIEEAKNNIEKSSKVLSNIDTNTKPAQTDSTIEKYSYER